jgi:hypothetical protein
VERLDQGGFVDDGPSGRVDQDGGRLHHPEFGGGDEAPRAIVEDWVDGQRVRAAEQLPLRDETRTRRRSALGREILAPGDAFHPERFCDRDHAAAELAEPQY